MKGWLDAMLANLIIIYGAAIAVIGVLAAALAAKHWWSSNPFHYPYLYIDFDVSGKRNPDPYDYLDEYLCQPNALKAIVAHEKRVERWKEEEAERAGKMPFSERRRVMQRDDYTCQICGKRMPDGVGLHVDHIVPIAKGGKTVESNLQVLCSKCNGRKGAKG